MSINQGMSKSTILIVDDDRLSLTLLHKLVSKLNYKVVLAEDGAKALEILKNEAVDGVIADYEMPGINGLELLKKVKEQFPSLPFILVTAYSNLAVIREAWYCGAFDFFQKPVFVDRLNLTINLAVEFGHLSVARRKFPILEKTKPDPDFINIGVVGELAIALDREDVSKIVEEYETHARIELEQLIRLNMAKQHEQVRMLAHRMAGTAINLGLAKFSQEVREIELEPKALISDAPGLQKNLEKSIFWLHHFLDQFYQDLAS